MRKTHKNKVLALLLSLAMIITCMPGTAMIALAAGEPANVAKIGDTEYATLQEAISYATEGQTITLLANVEENVVVEAGKNTILDLNGKVINGKQSANQQTILNEGTLEIRNGTVTRTGVGSSSYYVIENQGTMNLNATVSGSASASLIRNNAASAVLNISDGTYTQTGAFIVLKNDLGTVNVSGGTFTTQTDKAVLNNWDTMTISGGTFNGQILNGAYDTDNNKLTITNGTFNSSKIRTYTGNGKTSAPIEISGGTFNNADMMFAHEGTATKNQSSISGGTFSSEAFKEYCADSFQPKDNGDGTWTVEEAKTFVAQIGDKKYESLQEAINNATNGQTVTLLVDLENTGSVNLPAGVTLDGDIHKISGDSAIYINAEGGAVKNVNFENIHNTASASKDDCDYYGWTDGKTGTLSAIYANGLTGTLSITDCTFDNVDWDAIQITPVDGASITIKDNLFEHTDTENCTQLRYIHIQHTGSAIPANVTMAINGNKFYKTKDTSAKQITTICTSTVDVLNSNVDLTGNYFEYEGDILYTNAEIKRDASFNNHGEKLFPAIGNDGNALNPVQVIGNIAYLSNEVAYGVKCNNTYKYYTLGELIADGKPTAILLRDINENVTIPEGLTLQIQHGTYKLEGTIVNNGTLNLYSSTTGSPVSTATITNNGTVLMNCNAATGYTVNGGRVEISKGGTYDLNKINADTIVITGGTFTTKPDDSMLKDFYVAEKNSNGTYTVRKMKKEEMIEAGAIAYGTTTSYGSATNYYKTLENIAEYAVVLMKDAIGYELSSANYVYLNTNGNKFHGSINTPGHYTRIDKSFGVEVTDVTGLRLEIGAWNEAASATILNSHDLENLQVNSKGECTIEGGKFDKVTLQWRYTTSGDVDYTGTLNIKGGLFKSDTVDIATSAKPKDVNAPDPQPLANYVADGYEVVANPDPDTKGDYPWTVGVATHTVQLTSAYGTPDNETTIAHLSGGGVYTKGDKTTISAPSLTGFAFDGWYLNGEKVSGAHDYTITVTEDCTYVAVYNKSSSSSVTITAGTNGEGTVNKTSVSAAIGETVIITATPADGKKFVYWTNKHGRVLSKSKTLDIVAVNDMEVIAVFSDSSSSTVVFQDASGNILSAQTYTSESVSGIDMVIAPSKMGSKWTGWTATEDVDTGSKHIKAGDKLTDEDVAAIIKASHDKTHITVRADYKQIDTYTIKVYAVINGERFDDPIIDVTRNVGTPVVINVDGESYLGVPLQQINHNDDVILTNSFTVNPTAGVYEYEAIFKDGAVMDNAIGTISINSPVASYTNSEKIDLTMAWTLPEGATFVDAGFYCHANKDAVENKSKGDCHTGIFSNTGSTTAHLNVAGHLDKPVYALAFVKYRYNNNEYVMYSSTIGCKSFSLNDPASDAYALTVRSYNELSAK